MKQVLKCGKLFTAVDQEVKKDQAVIVEDGRITAILPLDQWKDDGACTVIDLSDRFVMPGLIEGHMHCTMNGAPDISMMGHATIGDYTIAAIKNVQKDLMAGFTTIRDEGAVGFSDVSVKNAINRGVLWGPRMLVAGVPITATGGHADGHFAPDVYGNTGMGRVISGADQARDAARWTLKYGADLVKVMATGGVMSKGDEPGSQELTDDELRAVCEVASFSGAITSAHAHGCAGVKAAARAGITSIEHGMILDDEAVELMVEHGTYLIPTIIAAQAIVEKGIAAGIPEYSVRKAAYVLSSHKQGLAKCRAAGVKIGFGTDAGTPFNFHGEQAREFALMVDFGFKPAETLIAATRTNATMMKLIDKVGTLEEGKLADIVAFAADPLEDITVMTNVDFVMKDGVVYKEQGKALYA